MNALTLPDNPRAVIGGNNPPAHTPIERAETAYGDVSKILADVPVVQTDEEASRLKVQHDLLRGHEQELEEIRTGLVRPLNEQVAGINGLYNPLRDRLKKLREIVAKRLGVYAAEQERIRDAEIAEKNRVAEELRQKALAAEAAEREAIENAAAGECTDVGGATAAADDAFLAAKQAARDAARTARQTTKISGGTGRALGLRTTETLAVDDPVKAIKALMKASDGRLDEKIEAAILTAARAYRKTRGALPAGISATTSRGL